MAFQQIDIPQSVMAQLWISNFKRKAFGRCSICNNQVRVSPEVSKILKINNYENMKYPHVFWCENNPVCYRCNNVYHQEGNNNYTTTKQIYEEIYKPTGGYMYYLQNWYSNNNYCIYGNNKYRLCGNKNVFGNNLCEKHYLRNEREADGGGLKKPKLAGGRF